MTEPNDDRRLDAAEETGTEASGPDPTARVLRFPSERLDETTDTHARSTAAAEAEAAEPSDADRSGPDQSGADEADEVQSVDPPRSASPGSGELVRRQRWQPILPAWAKDRHEFRDTATWALSYSGYVAAFHGVRTPVYVGRLGLRVPHGLVQVVQALARWLSDEEGRPVRHAAARREDVAEYLKLSRQRDGRVRARAFQAVALALLGVGLLIAGHAFLPVLAQWLLAAGVLGGLGWLGAPSDHPIAQRATDSTKAPKLTANAVESALASLGIAGINQAMGKGGQGIGFPKPIQRDGKGWRADIDLPSGVVPGDIMDRREKLASGLRRPVGCVWPEADNEEHAGRMILWVGDQDMRKAKQPTWALQKAPKVDLFQPQPFGTNQRGRWIDVRLMFTAWAIGAIPRMGKTFALRELLLIAALDPRAELHTYDLKGTGDLDPLEPVTHVHGVGDDEEELDTAITDLRSLRTELRRRAKLIRQLAKQGKAPENKVTPELASNPTYGLHPIVIGVDECQVWFESEHGDELEAICTDLVKRGPALGIVLILATQRPDAKSLPTGISANVSNRFCLKVQGQTENDMVLGTSKYKQGVRATTFAWADKGIGYLVGEGADADIVRTVAGLDGPAADKIVTQARSYREQAGTLSGHAIGQQLDTSESTRDTLLEDLLVVVAENEPKIWNERAIPRLHQHRPGAYDTYTKPEDLTAALKRHGIRTGQVWGTTDDGKGANRTGFARDDIHRTLTERDRDASSGAAASRRST